jgi:uncharacterized protein
MIAVDTNLLVYAHREDSPFHEQAFTKIEDLANSTAAWAIPWPCLHEFYSIVTHPRVFDPSSAMEIAIDQLEAWLECPGLNLIGETAGPLASTGTNTESCESHRAACSRCPNSSHLSATWYR